MIREADNVQIVRAANVGVPRKSQDEFFGVKSAIKNAKDRYLTRFGGGNNRTRTYDILLVRQALSQLSYAPILFDCKQFFFGDPRENRTPVTAVKGRCLNRLTMGP